MGKVEKKRLITILSHRPHEIRKSSDAATEANSATTTKTLVCTLHLTLRTLYIVLENQNLIINNSINNT